MESFPPTPVTTYGIQLLEEGFEPHITYVSPDGDVAFYLNGGLAPWPGVTEGIVLADGMTGLHPTFTHLDHKGARTAGVLWAGTVYDAGELSMEVTATARTPEGLRDVIRKWIAAWDPEKPGTLSWVTPDGGEWWCTPRLMRPPPEKLARSMARSREQKFTWSIRNDDAFWRSHDSVGQFVPAYERATDTFYRDDDGTLGANWVQTYAGLGRGVCETDKSGARAPGRAVWSANDQDTFFTGTRAVTIGPFRGFSSTSDDVDVTIAINNTPEYSVGAGAANDIWARMGRDGSGNWDGSGIRARIGWGYTRISYFFNFVEHTLDQNFQQFPPIAGEKYTLRCVGRTYSLRRTNFAGTFTLVSVAEADNSSQKDAAHRGVGFGLQGGAAIFTQASPADIRQVEVGGVVLDTFDYSTTTGLGSNWPLRYTGSSTGYVRATGNRTKWVDTAPGRSCRNRWLGESASQTVAVNGAPTTWRLSYKGSPTAAITHPATPDTVRLALEGLPQIAPGDVAVTGSTGGPYTVHFQGTLATNDIDAMVGTVVSGGTSPFIQVAKTVGGSAATTATDNQVISVTLGNLFEFPTGDASFIDIWGRMNTNDASPTGIRLRIGPQWVRLSRFNAGVEKVLYQRPLLLLPLWGEKWTLMCGSGKKARRFKVKRGDFTVIDFTESGTGSAMGAAYRGVGFGMESGDGVFHQQVPPSILDWQMGDNVEVTQTGQFELTNVGDQTAYPDIVVYGPGTFTFSDGPGKEPTIVFGPLTDGQIALVKTHPSKRGVYDLTAEQPEQDLPGFQSFIKSLFSFAFNANTPPLAGWFQSLFGISPPQGSLYSLLKGRWTTGVPPRSVMSAPESSVYSVKIEKGNADSKVIAALTPVRRWPE